MKIEIEIASGIWEEVDPQDLYDDQMVSMATYFDNETVNDQLDGTYWWTFDFTMPPKKIRIVKS
jgi:hypothetical protein